MPVYNDCDVLDKSLGSVINQTLTDIELICVNDGSSDDSLNKLESYADKHDFIKVFSQENQGAGKARNYAMNLAEGDYIGFLDADDFFIDKTALEQLYETAISNDATMVTGNMLHDVDVPGEFIPFKHLEYFTKEKTILPEQYGIPWSFYKSIYKKDFLINNEIYFPDLRRGEDDVFMAEILKKVDKIYAIPCDVYAYVFYDAIDRCNTFEKLYDQLLHYKLTLDFLDEPRFKKAIFDFKQSFIWFMDNLDADTLKKSLKILNEIFDKDSDTLNFVKGYFYHKYCNDDIFEELSEFEINPKKPSVSIISRVRNYSNSLWMYYNNIFNQTFYDFELICVNDGSTDNSWKILNDISNHDSRVTIIDNEPDNNGLAWKNALDIAQGDYVFFHNPNYNYSIGTLEDLYRNAIVNNSDIVMFKIKEGMFTGFEGLLAYDFDEVFQDVDFNNFTFSYEDIKGHVLNSVLSPWFKLYKKEFLDENNYLYLDLENSLNYILLHISSLLEAKNISFIPIEYNFFDYELGDNQKVKITDVISILNEIKIFLEKSGHYSEFKEDYNILTLYIIYKYLPYFNSKDFFKLSRRIISRLNLNVDELPFNLFLMYDLIVNSKNYDEFCFKNEWVSSSTSSDEYDLINKLNDLNKSKKDLKKRNKLLKKDIKELKNFNKNLSSSSSLKLTKPLRKL